jgi:hypothetical protein
MYSIFRRCTVSSIVAGIANESGIKVSSVAKPGNHLTKHILSKDSLIESGNDKGRFHIVVGKESGKFSWVHRDRGMCQGPLFGHRKLETYGVRRWEIERNVLCPSITVFPPAAPEGNVNIGT